MVVATHTPRAGLIAPSEAALRDDAPATLVHGVLQRLTAARAAIECGADPRLLLRDSIRGIRRLPSVLTTPDDPMAEGLADLCRYLCRRLRTLDSATGPGTLDEICELLREIDRAWVTLPAAGRTLG